MFFLKTTKEERKPAVLRRTSRISINIINLMMRKRRIYLASIYIISTFGYSDTWNTFSMQNNNFEGTKCTIYKVSCAFAGNVNCAISKRLAIFLNKAVLWWNWNCRVFVRREKKRAESSFTSGIFFFTAVCAAGFSPALRNINWS